MSSGSRIVSWSGGTLGGGGARRSGGWVESLGQTVLGLEAGWAAGWVCAAGTMLCLSLDHAWSWASPGGSAESPCLSGVSSWGCRLSVRPKHSYPEAEELGGG